MKKILHRLAKSILIGVTSTVFAMNMAYAEKITMWDVETQSTLKNEIDRQAEAFSKGTPGYEVNAIHIQNDPYKTKLKVAMGGGKAPDIFGNWGGGPLKAYIDAGMVEPIDEAMKAELLKTYIKGSFDPATFDGKSYGVAYSGLMGVFVWYNKDIFNKHNLTPPKTWAEFLEVGETLKKKGVIPIAFANKNKWPGSFYYMYLADRLGGPDMFLKALYRKEGGTFEDPAYVKAGEMVQELVKRGFFPKGFNGLDEDTGGARVLLYSGRAAMYVMGNWFTSVVKNEAPDLVEKFDFFNFPAVEGGKGDPSNLIGSPGQTYYSVTSTSKHKDQAMAFLSKHIMNEDYTRFLAENGIIPPVKNAGKYISDPILGRIAESFQQANHVQVYYDQFMSPALGEIHKDLVQNLFGLKMSPDDVAKAHEEAATK